MKFRKNRDFCEKSKENVTPMASSAETKIENFKKIIIFAKN
jgi:hypothetical protein